MFGCVGIIVMTIHFVLASGADVQGVVAGAVGPAVVAATGGGSTAVSSSRSMVMVTSSMVGKCS